MNRTNKKKKMFDVVGLGACAYDLLGVVPSFPRPDTKNKMVRFIQQGGGPVATALVSLARLGVRTSFIGKLGDNEFSHSVIDELIKEGVDINNIIKEEAAGPHFAFVLVDEKKGSRTIYWTDQMVADLKRDALNKDYITSCRVLHLDDSDLSAAILAASWAKEEGIMTVLDAENPRKKQLLSLVKVIDYLIVPEEFALTFSGTDNAEEATHCLLKKGPKVVVVTQGKRGSFTRTRKKSFYQPAFKVSVVDTTGCGDVFHGGFIYGLLKNWPIEAVCEFASAVAAIKCERLGGRAGCPSLEKVREFLLSSGSGRIKSFLQ